MYRGAIYTYRGPYHFSCDRETVAEVKERCDQWARENGCNDFSWDDEMMMGDTVRIESGRDITCMISEV